MVMNGSQLIRMPLFKSGLARFGVETKHETKPNLPNSADMMFSVDDDNTIDW